MFPEEETWGRYDQIVSNLLRLKAVEPSYSFFFFNFKGNQTNLKKKKKKTT